MSIDLNPLGAIQLRDSRNMAGWDAFSTGLDAMGNLDTHLKDKYLTTGNGQYGLFAGFGESSGAQGGEPTGFAAFGKQPELADVHRSAQIRGLNHNQGVIDEKTQRPERDRQFEHKVDQDLWSRKLAEGKLEQENELAKMKQMEDDLKRLKPEQMAALNLLEKENWQDSEKRQVVDAASNLFSNNPNSQWGFARAVIPENKLGSFDNAVVSAFTPWLKQAAAAGNRGAGELLNFLVNKPGEAIASVMGGMSGDEQARQQLMRVILTETPKHMDDKLARDYLGSHFNSADKRAFNAGRLQQPQQEQTSGNITKEQLEQYLGGLSDAELSEWMEQMGLM